LKQLIESLPTRPFVALDIGCTGMGTKPGLEVGDALLAMGSSIGVATGVASMGRKSIAIIGDSTFLHAGLPALQNAIALQVDLLVCILDNGHAAMTGGPATPGSDRLAAIALGLGASAIAVVDPFDAASMAASLQRLLDSPGTNVLISRSPCALTIPAKPRRPRVNREACTGCGDCVTLIHCPAISLDAERKFNVNNDLCVGCGFCSVICPEKALTPEPFPP
jgi:indolepyruvate ferredoxin oxidoreductase alpha subunit